MNDRGSNICKKAVNTFGSDVQEMMFIEEIADVEIMLEQLKHIHKCHGEVDYWRDKKLMRLCGRIEARN